MTGLAVPIVSEWTLTNTYFLCFRVQTVDCGEEVSVWLSEFLGKPCCLIRQSPSFARDMKMGKGKGTALCIPHPINHYIMTVADILCVFSRNVMQVMCGISFC